MHVELIGCTSSGKSTMIHRLVNTTTNGELELTPATEWLLRSPWLPTVPGKTLSAALIHLLAFSECLKPRSQHVAFRQFSVEVLREMAIPSRHRWKQARRVFKQLGCYQAIAGRTARNELVLVDEGTVHAAHNLFIHVGIEPDRQQLERFAELVPLPDLIVCVQEDEDVLIRRTLARGHSRIPGDAEEQTVRQFVRRATATFEQLVHHPRLRNRTIRITPTTIVAPPPSVAPPEAARVLTLLEGTLQQSVVAPSSECDIPEGELR